MATLPSSTSNSVTVFQLRRRGLLVLALVLVIPWLVVIWLALSRSPAMAVPALESPPVATTKPSRSPDQDRDLTISTGPWGQLETNRVLIEPPTSLLNLASLPGIDTYWYFNTTEIGEVRQLFESIPLDATQRDILLNENNWRLVSDGIEVPISKPLVLSLGPEARSQIYRSLARHRKNNNQLITFGFRGDFEEWFDHSDVDESTLAIVRPLVYRRGNALQFSDLPLIINDIPTMHERLALVRALARTRTQMARIRIFPDSDHLSIAKYWSTGRDPSRIESLLNSVPRIEEGYPLDIIHLLPNFARRLLYTYPQLNSPGQVSVRDCHWTSLNFTKPEIDNSLADMAEVQRQYQQEYYHTTEAPQFGDILLFVEPNGTVLHSCVQIADTLVFTKNGTSLANPWILMQLPDVLALYPSEAGVDIQILRARN